MNDDDIHLLECPFCGSTRTEIHGAISFYGICLECEATSGLCQSKAEAQEKWNRRESKQ